MHSERKAPWIASLTLALSSSWIVATAHAADEDQNKKIATDLFDTAVRKMEEGKCEQSPVGDAAICREARDAYRRAYEIYPDGLGALRNLAFVEKNLGLVASAARNFRELTRRAPLDPNPARRLWAEFARKEYEALAPLVPVLTVKVAEPPDGLQLSLDGEPLPAAAWETPLELDPGEHTVRAEAPGYEPFERTLEIAEAAEDDLEIVLVPSPVDETAAETPASSGPPERDVPPSSGSKLGPIIVGGAGVATLGVGLTLGYIAIKKRQSACGDSRFCEPNELESGRSIARAATFVTIIGGAAIAGGLVWYFLVPSDPKKTAVVPEIAPGRLGFSATGTF